jgi:hypothetical protein
MAPQATAGPRPIPWHLVSYGFALIVVAGLSYFLWRMPLQVSDNVALIMIAQARSVREIIGTELRTGSWQMRPLLQLSVNLAFEIADALGAYFLTFKGIQIAQLSALLLMFTRLLRVANARDFAAACVAVVAVVGMHTFYSTIYEMYPINTYMTILVCCALALVLADGPPSWWRDPAAVALFVFALFTVETGVLVWVIIVSAFIVGLRGVTIRGVAGLTAVLCIYLAVKFFWLTGGVPALDQVSASFGFRSYSQQELVENFSDRRLTFYAANVASSLLTVLFAEPRAGWWRFTQVVVTGQPVPLAMWLYVVTSTASTLLIAWFVWVRRQAWRRLELGRGEQLLAVFVAVLGANAAMSFPYTKDAIMSPTGLLFPLVLFGALREALGRIGSASRPLGIVAACFLVLLSFGWTLRAASVPQALLRTAYYYQQQWVHVDQWQIDQGLHYDGAQLALIDRLRTEALLKEVPDVDRVNGWMRWAGFLFDRP